MRKKTNFRKIGKFVWRRSYMAMKNKHGDYIRYHTNGKNQRAGDVRMCHVKSARRS